MLFLRYRVLADECSNVHILGSVQNIKIARDAIVSLILGSPPGQSSPNATTLATAIAETSA
jgi:RNA-binding protein PNO1